MNQSNITESNATMTDVYESRQIYDKIPPDAYVVFIGIIVFVILILIRRRYRQRRLRREMLERLDEDMDAMRNIARASKLTAEEYKALYEKAKEEVDHMDFSKYEKKKKRKHKWAELEEKERQQQKRERLRKNRTENESESQNENASESESENENENGIENENVSSESDEEFSKVFEKEDTEVSSNTNTVAENSVIISD